MNTHLLTEADLVELELAGPTRTPGPDLVLVTSRGLVFTVRGMQYFAHALNFHRIDANLSEAKTLAELQAICASIRTIIRERSRQALAAEYMAGKVPVRDREIVHAKLFGTLEKTIDAMDRRIQLAAAGANIIPLRFH